MSSLTACIPVTLEQVRAALSRPLPGLRGQARMAPSHRVVDRVVYEQGSRDCRRAAVLFLLYPHQGELHTLLTVRPDDLSDHPGQVAFPGGARHEGETVLQTALREAQEEVGLDPELVQPLGRLTHLYIAPSHFCIQIQVGYAPARPRWRPNPQEIASLVEAPVSHFFDQAKWRETTWEIDGVNRVIPYFQLGGYKLWGATAMAMAEFVTAVEEASLPAHHARN